MQDLPKPWRCRHTQIVFNWGVELLICAPCAYEAQIMIIDSHFIYFGILLNISLFNQAFNKHCFFYFEELIQLENLV